MKKHVAGLCAAVLMAAGIAAPVSAQSVGTGFTYQGKLKLSGSAVNGSADLQFRLFDSSTGGNQIGSTVSVSGATIADGLFTQTLDFGSDAFDGRARWLEVAVRSPAGSGSFVILTPRQAMTVAPYARFAARPWVVNGSDISYGAGTVSVGAGTLTGAGAPALSVTKNWNDEHGALTLLGDKPTLRFSGGAAANNQSWIAHLGTAGHFGFFKRNGSALWQDVLAMTPAGNVGIGTLNPTSRLEIVAQDGLAITGFQPFITLRDTGANNARALLSSGGGDIGFYTNSAIATGIPPVLIKDGSEYVGFGDTAPQFRVELPNIANADGQIRANAHVTYSSARWKENVQTLTSALGTVMRLRGVSFDWKPEHGGKHDIGFVAEEVGAVVPELVRWEADGQWAQGLAYDRVTALTVEAIKEQQGQIEALRRDNAALRVQLEGMMRQLAAQAAAQTAK